MDDLLEEKLVPWGKLIDGKSGLSAPRIAEILKVTSSLIKKILVPCGIMKMPGKNEFYVYDVDLLDKICDHPEIVKGQIRKEKRQGQNYTILVEKRRKKCIDYISNKRQDIYSLYVSLVNKLWNPAIERDILECELYSEFPAMLWDALLSKKECEEKAIEIITNIIWAMTKQRTWKVNKDFGEQDEPLSLQIYQDDLSINENLEIYKNMFAAAIRHVYWDNLPKSEGREKALIDLKIISNRDWEI